MAEPFIGEIKMFGGTFAPRGFALCDGQLLNISQYSALFSILGTTYGGDGRTTFGLPDLRGRVPVHSGMGPGLSRVNLGERAGIQNTTLSVNNIPQLEVPVNIPSSSEEADEDSPNGNVLAFATEDVLAYTGPDNADGNLAPITATTGGTGTSFDNRQPYLGINFIIALTGLFPSRF